MLIGLVGKPNCGKSTFFKASTLANVEIGNRPFVTIAPNHGIGYVRIECIDKEFNTNCNPNHGFCINHHRFVPVELMDVAGLVPGASEGKGLGNQFLDELRQADAFVHIVDVSGTLDVEGKPVENHDVCKDVEFLEDELNKWFYNILMKIWRSFARKAEIENMKFSEAVAHQFSGLKVKEEHVKDVLLKLDFSKKPSTWNKEQLKEFAVALRKKSKPMIIAANKIDTKDGKKNFEKLVKEFLDLMIVPCSADFELALREAAKKELIEYIPGDDDFKIKGELNDPENQGFSVSKSPEKMKQGLSDKQKQALENIKKVLKEYNGTGVQEVLNMAVFNLLKYIAVFPVDSANKLTDSKGKVLPDCFLLPEASTALDFAFHLHTDFGDNFIKAIDAKTKRALGKSYVLKNKDVLEIVTR